MTDSPQKLEVCSTLHSHMEEAGLPLPSNSDQLAQAPFRQLSSPGSVSRHSASHTSLRRRSLLNLVSSRVFLKLLSFLLPEFSGASLQDGLSHLPLRTSLCFNELLFRMKCFKWLLTLPMGQSPGLVLSLSLV